MRQTNRILFTIVCVLVLIISWVVVLGSKSNGEKQAELLAQAGAYMNDEVYILAIPLLEEASGYNASHTFEAENELKKAYLYLIDQIGYQRKYLNVLDKQMNRHDASADVFMEAANFYLDKSRVQDSLVVLRKGIDKTGSQELVNLYEQNRYAYQLNRNAYQDVTDIYGTTIGVKSNELWGLAKSDGVLLVPCEYKKISTYSTDRFIVQKGNEIYAVDSSNNRLALLKETVSDFGNYAGGRVTLLTSEGWRRATGDFELGSAVFEDIGTYSDGYVAAKKNGKWGVVDISSEWLIPPEYEGIIMDELGRSCQQGAVFVRCQNGVFLFADGKQLETKFDDAKPFNENGYAAVKQNGKWGYVDTTGEVKIEYQFEEAFSFGQHLAAVKLGDLWGYISLQGEVVIEPIFIKAKSFSGGNAPVLTDRGWQFITLIEYKKGVSL